MPEKQNRRHDDPDHRMSGCEVHDQCRDYNKYLAEWTERLAPETQAYRDSQMITAEDLAIIINCKDY